jgi:PknH-like extracellular domain
MTVVRVGLARAVWAVALLSIGLLATGCTVVTGGKAQAPPGLGHRSLSGQTIRRVLLGDETLSRILQEPFIIDRRLPPRFGGPEALQDLGSGLSVDCLGVAEMLHQSVYRSGQVNDVAVENWRHAFRSAKLTGVKEGVVSLPTAADANALFSRFAQQWQRCDGQTLLIPDPVLRLKATITNVQVAPTVLAGTVSIAFASSSSDTLPILAGRAIGVRGNCLVEVEVDFFNASSRSMQGSSVTNATAFDIVQAMMDRVSELS